VAIIAIIAVFSAVDGNRITLANGRPGLRIAVDHGITMDLAHIDSGAFIMGSALEEPGHFANETQHEVTISRGFYIGLTPVTQAQWTALMSSNPSHFRGEDLPVENVTWTEATTFCEQLSQKINRHVRLPTEAEWEYVCRAGNSAPTFVAKALDEVSWYEANSNDVVHAVQGKKPNAWGVYDMCGNVAQWCDDWFEEYPRHEVTDPPGPLLGTSRVVRGGSWLSLARCCRAAYRFKASPDERNNYTGFRVAIDERD